MTWKELRDKIDKHIEESGYKADNIVVRYIDLNNPSIGRVDINISPEHGELEMIVES